MHIGQNCLNVSVHGVSVIGARTAADSRIRDTTKKDEGRYDRLVEMIRWLSVDRIWPFGPLFSPMYMRVLSWLVVTPVRPIGSPVYLIQLWSM